jgi:hypothetical protein
MGADEYFGFLAYVGERDIDGVLSGLDRGLARAGFVLSESSGDVSFKRTYASPSGTPIRCCGSVSGLATQSLMPDKWGVWAFFPIEYSELRQFAEGQLVTAIREACVETRTVLGRSFHTGGICGVNREELDGRVDLIDWIQYFGPDVSGVLGQVRIQEAGFHSVQRLTNGANLALTRPGYLDDWPREGLRPLMDRLGLVPRRWVHKHLDGHEEEICWC